MIEQTLLPVEEFVKRRNAFCKKMPPNSIAVFFAAKEVTRSNDTEYLFCQNKSFYYLTGFNEPDAILFLIKSDECESVLLCNEKDPLQEIWHGKRVGPEQAARKFQFDRTASIQELDSIVEEVFNEKDSVLYCFPESHTSICDATKIPQWITNVARGSRVGKKAPSKILDCTTIIDDMRLIKSDAEIELMKRVNVISGKAHQRAMEKTIVGMFEYQIEAEILHEFARHGARHAAYNSIVAGGNNANILHYTNNNERLNDGDLLLIDAGGELAGYAADITRTFPINGKFSAPQKALYQLVLDSQNAAIEAIKPNVSFADLNLLVGEILTKGLHQLGILTGNLDELVEENACKKYFIHGLGHWLGLDVHDVGDYQTNELRQQLRPFEQGMVMTIEPGLYIPEDAEVDDKWRGIAIRIEDNVLVTENGAENLTNNVPKTIDAIESVMAHKSAELSAE